MAMASRDLRRAVRSGDLAAVKTMVNGKGMANQISNAHVGSTLLFAAVQVRRGRPARCRPLPLHPPAFLHALR